MALNLSVRRGTLRPKYPSLLLPQRPEPPNLQRRCLFPRKGDVYIDHIYHFAFCLDIPWFRGADRNFTYCCQICSLHIGTVISYASFFFYICSFGDCL